RSSKANTKVIQSAIHRQSDTDRRVMIPNAMANTAQPVWILKFRSVRKVSKIPRRAFVNGFRLGLFIILLSLLSFVKDASAFDFTDKAIQNRQKSDAKYDYSEHQHPFIDGEVLLHEKRTQYAQGRAQ